MQTILVTGCAGFIGSHVCENLLHLGNKVIGIDNFDDFYSKDVKLKNLATCQEHANFEFHQLDISEKKNFKQINGSIDAVIHLAAKAGVLPSLKDPASYINSNILGTNHLLDFMVEKGISKLLFASSSSVYGNNTKIPFAETDEVNGPISPYAFTKRSCELMNYSYHDLYNIDIVNMRFFTVYGPRQRPDLAIHKFFKLIAAGEPIQMYGDGSTARDYTFVADTVSGITKALNYVNEHENVFEIVNLGNHSPVSLKELIAEIYAINGVEPNIVQQDMQPGDVNITYADISRAKELFDYNPQTKLVDGLAKFKTWFQQEYGKA
ncbi:MAG: UDP-glucuronate 4-epimerase [Chitinophagales bacterium]|jgi:UDP-glucuronate 4-epimerase